MDPIQAADSEISPIERPEMKKIIDRATEILLEFTNCDECKNPYGVNLMQAHLVNDPDTLICGLCAFTKRQEAQPFHAYNELIARIKEHGLEEFLDSYMKGRIMNTKGLIECQLCDLAYDPNYSPRLFACGHTVCADCCGEHYCSFCKASVRIHKNQRLKYFFKFIFSTIEAIRKPKGKDLSESDSDEDWSDSSDSHEETDCSCSDCEQESSDESLASEQSSIPASTAATEPIITEPMRIKAWKRMQRFIEEKRLEEEKAKKLYTCSKCQEVTPIRKRFFCDTCDGEMFCSCCIVTSHWGHRIRSELDEKRTALIDEMKKEFDATHSNLIIEADNLNFDIGRMMEEEIKGQFEALMEMTNEKSDSFSILHDIREDIKEISGKMDESFGEFRADCQKFIDKLKKIKLDMRKVCDELEPMHDVNFAKIQAQANQYPRIDSFHSTSGGDSE